MTTNKKFKENRYMDHLWWIEIDSCMISTNFIQIPCIYFFKCCITCIYFKWIIPSKIKNDFFQNLHIFSIGSISIVSDRVWMRYFHCDVTSVERRTAFIDVYGSCCTRTKKSPTSCHLIPLGRRPYSHF